MTRKFIITRNRLRSLKMTLLSTASHRWPYDINAEAYALQTAGLLDAGYRITLAGAMLVLKDTAAIEVDWVAVQETQRVLNEIKVMFSEQLGR